MNKPLHVETERIREEYRRREREIPADFYALTRPVNLFSRHSKERAMLQALRKASLLPLTSRRVLDVGCGNGDWLAMFEGFEVQRENLCGIDLDPQRADACSRRFPGADIRTGDAGELPWPDAQFDIVFQSTVFTSILDAQVKQAVATQMIRVLKPGGCILWYDFFVNNPSNPHVRGVGRREIQRLFPGFQLSTRRVTLVPPLARRIVPVSWALAGLLERLRLLNTFYLAVLWRSG